MPASSSSPYRRVGTNSWEELLNQVNEELQNPPDGCDPIDEIQTPESPHRWAKSDIREVHDKLDEMPTDCFTWEEIPDLWKVSIITEIEDQLGESWCDCEPECCYPCPNCADRETHFVATESVDANDCTECGGSSSDLEFCNNIRDTQYEPAVADFNEVGTYSGSYSEWCERTDELEELQDELEKLQDQLEALEQAKQDCISGCDPEDTGCVSNCNATYDPQIEAKQEEVDAKQEEVDEKQQEVDELFTEWNEAKTTYQGKCQAMNNAVDSMVLCDYVAARDLSDGFSKPIPQSIVEVCYDPGDASPDGPAPYCCGRDFWRCRSGWVMYRRTYETVSTGCSGIPLTPYDSGFRASFGGVFDIDGTPCNTNTGRSYGCVPFHLQYYCYSNCCCCLSPCGACCGHPNNDYNYDWEMRISNPRCFTEFNCEGGPCDGDNGGGESPPPE